MNIVELEEISMQALPALETQQYDGWVLRFANGYTRRANSVYPLYPHSIDLIEKIKFCEALFSQKQIPLNFKMTAAAPDQLDVCLDEMGYIKRGITSVQTCQIADLAQPQLDGVDFIQDDALTDVWLLCFLDLAPTMQHHSTTMQQVLGRILPATCFLRVVEGKTVIGAGMAVADGDYVGLFDIISSPQARGRGIGRAIVLYLLAWGRSQGATKSYLQVVANNEPALRLYSKFGFEEAYQYWYRVQL